MARRSLAAAASVLSCTIIPAIAQSTTITTVHIPNADPQTIHASIVTATRGTITSYLLTCPTAGTEGYDDTDCGLGTGIRMAEGPKTFEYHIDGHNAIADWYQDVNCVIANRQTATCSVFRHGVTLDTTETLHTSFVNTNWDEWEMPVTLTVGLLAVYTTPSESESSSGPDVTSPTPTVAAPVPNTEVFTSQTESPEASRSQTGSTEASRSQTTGASPSQSTGASPSQATGGVPRATGNAFIAGVAAVFGGLLML